MTERYQSEKRIPTDRELLTLFRNVSSAIMPIYSQQDKKTVYKEAGSHSPQTEADRISHSFIVDFLKANAPYPVLSEESNEGRVDGLKSFWIVDPLDGTRSFMDGTGEFSLMVGLVENGLPVLGAVYFPTSEKFYIARKGEGAFLVEQDYSVSQLYVSKTAKPDECRLLISRAHLQERDMKIAEKLGVKQDHVIQSHGFGTKVCLLAEGKAEIYFNASAGTSIWDSIPNIAIIEEAGGKITDLDGNSLLTDPGNVHNDKGIVVTNGISHQRAIEKVKLVLGR